MKQIAKIENMLSYNFKTLLRFEILYKLASTLIFIPFFYFLFHQIVEITGYHYLTFENLFSFLRNPFTILFLILLLVIVTFCTLLDVSTVIIILDCSYQKKKISLKEAILLALKKSLRVFHFQNILLTFFLLFLIPFLHIGISSSLISTVSVPEFILDYIHANPVLSFLYSILLILLTFLLCRWLYTTHYFILEDQNFHQAKNSSIQLSKKNHWKDLWTIFFMEIGISLFYLLVVIIGIFFIVVVSYTLGKFILLGNISITIVWLILLFSIFVMMLLPTPISYACISALYYYHKEKKQEVMKHVKMNEKEFLQKNRFFQTIVAIVVVLVLIGGTVLTDAIRNQKLSFQFEYDRNVEVTAHRGASFLYPENTMSAFRGAKELGTDWIELDVQQTKDHQLIVLHDTNLKRTTGVSKNTWEVTYEEIKDLDAGSFFHTQYQSERIPLLEEVFIFAKENHIKLNIELKPTGKEVDFEKQVVDLIRKYQLENSCVVTSQVYEVLEKVKQYYQAIQTVYVMSFAYGDILSLKAADSFSIEASSITKTLVENIHAEGKEIYAWTVNTEESIQKMIQLNVDNIITDQITLAKDTISVQRPNSLLENYLEFLTNLLQQV